VAIEFNVCLEYSIRKAQENNMGFKLNYTSSAFLCW
jgi:hypothetical protein